VKNIAEMWRFYTQCFKLALTGAYGVTALFTTFAGIALAAIVDLKPHWVNQHVISVLSSLGGWIVPVVLFSSLLVIRLLLAPYWIYQKTCNERDALAHGPLRLTVVHFDYDEEAQELCAQLQFFNEDKVSQRTVIGVSFIYRRSESERGFEMFPTGTTNTHFIGHIDPVKLALQSEEIRPYRAHIDPSKFEIIGAEAGVHITFSVPRLANDTANIIAMKVAPSHLTRPAREFPRIERVSLDAISDNLKLLRFIKENAPKSSNLDEIGQTYTSIFDY
jgi:hypothetical protein